MSLGQKWRYIRELHGKTLEDVAGGIGIDISSLSRMERGLQKPPAEIRKRWNEIFFFDEDALQDLRQIV